MRLLDSLSRRSRIGSILSFGAMPATSLVPSAGFRRAARISAVWLARSFSLCSIRSRESWSFDKKICHSLDRPSSVSGCLRVFCLGFSLSVLDQVEMCHSSFQSYQNSKSERELVPPWLYGLQVAIRGLTLGVFPEPKNCSECAP